VAQPKKKSTRSYARWLLLTLIPAFWCLLAHYQWLDVLENNLLGLRYRVRGEIKSPVSVHYVDIDTRAIQYLGERPWDRGEFGRAAQVLLETGGAKAVGFDFVFSDVAVSQMVSRDDLGKRNFELGKVTHAHPNVVLAAQYTGGQAFIQEGQRRFPLLREGLNDPSKNDLPELPEYPIIGPTWGTVGLIDVDYGYGRDATPRWVPLFAHSAGPTFYNIGLRLALIDLGLDDSAIQIGPDKIELARPDGTTAASIPLQEHQLLEINWFSTWSGPGSDPHTSLADVMLYRKDLSSENENERLEAKKFFSVFENTIVLVGPTDPLLQDLAPTPFDQTPVPKVSVHANVLKTIRSGLFLRHLPEGMNIALAFLLTLAVASLAVAGGVKGIRYKIFAVVVLGVFVGFAFEMFSDYHLVLQMAAPLGSAFTASFAVVGWQLVLEEKQKGRIKGMFSTYLAPSLVNRMVESGEDPQLGGHEEVITAYFSDIQAFSTFSELMPPSQLVELMNEYLTVCTDIIQEESGTLDKYIGDAVVAIFGAPVMLEDHAYRACLTTLRVQQRIDDLREKWRSETGKWPEVVHNLRARLGLNTGPAIIGNMGSRTRFSYTMMGDNVNLAARMESGAKSLGVYIMVTESTRLACEKYGGDKIVFRYLDRIVVKGRKQPVPVFEVVGLREKLLPSTTECLGIYSQGIERYLAQDWDAAVQYFTQSAALELHQPHVRGVETNPSHVLINRCAYMKEHPPGADWDGVYVMKEK
jgi:adenylate cyclase